MIDKVQESHLYIWLNGKNSKFLNKLEEVLDYANNMLPLINNVFASYTIHGIKHSINVMEYMLLIQKQYAHMMGRMLFLPKERLIKVII